MAEPPNTLGVGEIVRPHGIRGEVRIKLTTDFPERVVKQDHLLLATSPNDDGESYAVERGRLHQGFAIIKFKTIADRNDAERLRGRYVKISMEQAVPLADDEYYHFQLVGLEMVTVEGESIGTVESILETGANDVYIVRSIKYGEILIPAIESVIQDINLADQKIIITPIPGLLGEDS